MSLNDIVYGYRCTVAGGHVFEVSAAPTGWPPFVAECPVCGGEAHRRFPNEADLPDEAA
jgi:hypothetical protein